MTKAMPYIDEDSDRFEAEEPKSTSYMDDRVIRSVEEGLASKSVRHI